MDETKRESLEARGYKVFAHAGDAVGMSDEEKQLLDIRVKLAISVRKRREKLKLTQKDLALRLNTTQPRIVKIERAAPDVSFDQIFRAYAVLGGRLLLKNAPTRQKKEKARAK